MKSHVLTVLVVLTCLASVQVCADEFFGYYTRLNYTIPIDEAADYIPTELTEESLLIIERMEALEGDWLQATREDPSFLVEMLEDPRYIWELLFIGMACLALLAVARRAIRKRRALAHMDDDDPYAP